jgi:hypothetical protein
MARASSADGLPTTTRSIVARLLGKPLTPAPTPQKDADASAWLRSQALRHLKEEFFRLAGESDRNKAGLALEPLLNKLFRGKIEGKSSFTRGLLIALNDVSGPRLTSAARQHG